MTDDPLRYLDALSAPMGDLIAAVGRGVAEAQQALDMGSLAALQTIYGDADDQTLALLREIDYRPTFYAIPEVTSELTVALTITGQSSSSSSTSVASTAPAAALAGPVSPAAELLARVDATRPRLYIAPVDAGYQNRYGFDLRATSSIKFKIVPVPPPSQADQLRVVPDLVGRSFADTRTLLGLYRLAWDQPAPAVGDPPLSDPADTDVVLTQSSAPGTFVRAGDVLTLTFGPPSP
jgi:hypothetical protein